MTPVWELMTRPAVLAGSIGLTANREPPSGGHWAATVGLRPAVRAVYNPGVEDTRKKSEGPKLGRLMAPDPPNESAFAQRYW